MSEDSTPIMPITDDEKRELESYADTVRKIYGQKGESTIDVVSMARNMGFKIFRSKFPNPMLSGFVVVDDEYKSKFDSDHIIAVNESDNYGHQRFTIAHELYHYLKDFDKTTQTTFYDAYRTDKADDVKEQKASYFAACLLMPKSDFTKAYEKLDGNDLYDIVKKLSDLFGVSMKAVERRIEEII